MIKISYSGTNVYIERPRAYYLHYFLRLREKMYSSAFLVGNLLDESLNVMLAANTNRLAKGQAKFIEMIDSPFKIDTGFVDVKTTDQIKWWKSDDDRTVWTDEDREMFAAGGINPQYITWRRKGLMMLEAYSEQVLPHLKEVKSVQREVSVTSESGDIVRGFLDLTAIWEQDKTAENYNPDLDKYNGKLILFDNKTSSVAYKEDSVRLSEQLGTYANCEGMNPDAEGYIVIPKKFRKLKEPKVNIQIIIDKVEESVVQSIFEKYDKALLGIKLGKFDCDIDACKKAKFGCPYVKYCETLSMDGLFIAPASDYKGEGKDNGSKKESNNCKAGKRTGKKGCGNSCS